MATCSSADSVLDAASQIKSNATKLNTFVNGTSTQTVQLGTGAATPTLRKFVADAQSIVTQAALDAGQTVLDDVAQNAQDIATLQSNKADKVSSATNGHLAGLNASGNLTDSGIASSNVALKSTDIATLQATKANKVSGVTAGDIAILDASGDLVDSGVKPADKADKVVDAVAGNFAGLDASGNLTDSGRSPADITALEEAVDSLEERKADKWVPAEPGNLAKLSSDGNLRDAGRAIEDFVPLLAYANGEAMELVWQNRVAIKHYREQAGRDMTFLAQAGGEALQFRQTVLSLVSGYDEVCVQHRLMQRLYSGANPTSSAKPVLFVIAGQSNATGQGSYEPFDTAVDCGEFWSWADGSNRLKPIVDPIGHAWGHGSGWCAFAKKFFAMTGRKVILLNIAYGGTYVTSVADEPVYNTWANDGHGTVRTSRKAVWDAFHAAVPDSSYDLGAILWIQGEYDGNRLRDGKITLQDYIDGTEDVFEWLRGEDMLNTPNCPILVGKIGYYCTPTTSILQIPSEAHKKIMEAQESLCDDETVYLGFSAAPYYWWSWETYMGDGVHYGPYGYKLQGETFARSAVRRLGF